MKATLVLTTLLGAAIASPVAVANPGAVQAEKRDLEVRQLSGISALSLPNAASLTGILSLLALPAAGSINAANAVATVAGLLSNVLQISNLLRIATNAGSISGLSLPAFPAGFPIPTPAVPAGGLSVEQATGAINILQAALQNVTAITAVLNSPNAGGLSTDQLKVLGAAVKEIQTQAQGVLKLIPAVPSIGGAPGSSLPTGGLSSATSALAPVLSTLTSLLGPVLGLLLSLGLLNSLLGGLPVPGL